MKSYKGGSGFRVEMVEGLLVLYADAVEMLAFDSDIISGVICSWSTGE